MKTNEALEQLGVRDDLLTSDERVFLDDNGYLPLEGILSPQQAGAFAARLTAIIEAESKLPDNQVGAEPGAGRLYNLVNKDPMFEVCYTHPRVLTAIAHVLGGDVKLSSLNCRFANPGEGLQGLHADGAMPAVPGAYEVCNSIWLLDDFTECNGATRVVPGSHRTGKLPEDEMVDRMASHPNETLLRAKAGTVVIFNAHTWHGGTLNQTDQPRRAMHSYFCRRHLKQQTDQRKHATDETRARLSKAAQHLLDID